MGAATLLDITALALLGFAGYRATQLAVHDTILDPVRDRLHAWHERRMESVGREFVITLISCVYCMGWWISGALLAVYLLVTGQFDDAPSSSTAWNGSPWPAPRCSSTG